MKNGWIRFMDETPPIGDRVIVAYSSAPYNGLSWAVSGKMIDNDTVLLLYGSESDFTVPIYNTKDFDSINRANGVFCMAYAHHWAYDTEENKKNLHIKQVCEADRRNRGEKQPVDVSLAK